MKKTSLLWALALFGAVVAFAAPPESPFATPLTAEEAAEGTGLETATPPDQWIPPEYGVRLGMGKLRARLARWGLHHDEEASASGRYCLGQRLSEKDGRGDIGLTFDDGRLALFDLNWSFDDGWSADEPGAVRDRLDAALRRLGPPTRRWVRERTIHFEENGSDETWIWYVWAWRQGDLEAFFEIRRSVSRPSDRYLRASFCAGAVRRLAPGTPEWLGELPEDTQADTAHWADFSAPIQPGWQLAKPFADANCETVPGFLVVEKVKDHPTIRGSGVEVGDICLSWGTLDPEPPETLREAWLAFMDNGAGDEDDVWFARDRDGRIEVFSCGMGELFECMVALGTFGLELRPVAFAKEDAERILAAAAARKAANLAERGELLTLSPPLQEDVEAFEYAFVTDDGAWRGRVDMMYGNYRRLALWRRGRSLSALPDFVSAVAWRPDGSGGNGCYEPVGDGIDPDSVRLWENNLGTDDTPPLVLAMQTPSGEESSLPAQQVPWDDLRAGQAALEPDPFTPEPPEPDLEKMLPPSLVQIPFEPVLCFEADDGTLAGRIDRLPTRHLGNGEDAGESGGFDDRLALYRISVFRTPIMAGREPTTVFLATRRMDGNNGSHTYVDVTWEYSLAVATQTIEPQGVVLTRLELNRWPMSTPELGLDMCEVSIPAHPVRWKDIFRTGGKEPEQGIPQPDGN